MQPIRRISLPITLLALAALLACDRQTDSSYQGDSLLTIRGSLAVPKEFEGVDLVPVLVFWSGEPSDTGSDYAYPYQEIINVNVKGEFPSKFTLDVFDPPLPDAYFELEEYRNPREPPVAWGRISAMARSHPAALIREQFSHTNCVHEYVFCPFDGNQRTLSAKDFESEVCYWQKIDCTDYESEETSDYCPNKNGDYCCKDTPTLNECTLLDSAGDSSLAFVGYSLNILVTYFPEPVPADTVSAYIFNRGKPISAGYHLYRVNQQDPNDPYILGKTPECLTQAKTEALNRYNEEHGTDFTESYLDQHSPQSAEVRQAFWDYHLTLCKLLIDADCPYECGFESYIPIKNPEAASISIELGALEEVTD
jgi:hypothetical protein